MDAYTPKILAFAGSARVDSLNKKLVKVAAAGAQRLGAKVTFIDLRDYPIPIYDGDLEVGTGVPDKALELRRLLLDHDGFLIACPEYNGSITPLLKNVIDWTSRPINGEDGLAPFRNKLAVLMSASPGGYGGLRGFAQVKTILGNMGVIVLPDQLAVGKANEVFAPNGHMINQKQRESVETLGSTLASTLARLHGQPVYDVAVERRHDMSRVV
ncbi:MAG: NADPH-dependent FMN reductase [Bryobacteraceae bacterium]